ncbi:MAG: HAD family hydrolase [Candidatus Muirbacterium halophilum]|nr:HAD family hydrolase [Candidatus Muirbacterium halophilum]MCK9476100.1 HAD family hydrolase [Candidatus Muirbacterium halophilum]
MKNIIFDADDTLWENQLFFNEFADYFKKILVENNIDVEQGCKVLLDFDEQSYKRHEFGNFYYIQSMIKTLKHFNIKSDDIFQKIKNKHDELFEHPPVLFDGVEEIINYLHNKNIKLYILTKGYYPVQMKKIEESCIEKFFVSVIISTRKNVQVYKNIISRYNLDEENTWMIGNSPKSDIIPALEAGMKAIYIPSNSLWELEHEELDYNNERLCKIESIKNLKEIF